MSDEDLAAELTRISQGALEFDDDEEVLRMAADRIRGLSSFKRWVVEALNSGNGSYKP